jgi:tRNA pseudouridine55 synthase
MSRKPPAAPGGLIIVDKAAGMTSHDVVSKLRRIVKTRRVGHAGTLDPMATGVLVIGVERATKLLNYLDLDRKGYQATIRLGAGTDTDDAEGAVTFAADALGITDAQLAAAMLPLTGDIMQTPSSVSALKIDGERAHALVRAGVAVQLDARPVNVWRFEVLVAPRRVEQFLDVDVVVECSSGTYVRALARDLGATLGVGGHLTALRRTRVGPFDLTHALPLEQIAASEHPIVLPLPQAIAAAMPSRALTPDEAAELSFGRTISPAGLTGTYGGFAVDGRAVALLVESGGRARPVLGFTPAGSGAPDVLSAQAPSD